MADMNQVIVMYLAFVFVAGLVALGWMHWYSKQQDKFLRDIEQQREQPPQPAE